MHTSHHHNPTSSSRLTAYVQGIGGGIARRFAQEGYTMALLTRDVANVEALRKQIEAEGGAATGIVCELGSHESIVEAFETAAALGPIEVLVLNPGYEPRRVRGAGGGPGRRDV